MPRPAPGSRTADFGQPTSPRARVPQSSACRRSPLGKRWSADIGPSKNATLRQHCITELQGWCRAGSDRHRGDGAAPPGRAAGRSAAAAAASRAFCRCDAVDTDRSWGRLENSRDFSRFDGFKLPPTSAVAQVTQFSASSCAGGGSEEPATRVKAHTHRSLSAHGPRQPGLRRGGTRLAKSLSVELFTRIFGPVSEEMAL